jgi:hypothetical protein
MHHIETLPNLTAEKPSTGGLGTNSWDEHVGRILGRVREEPRNYKIDDFCCILNTIIRQIAAHSVEARSGIEPLYAALQAAA